MNKYKYIILKKIKKYIDKMYYSEYTKDRETLIREMFPGINSIGEYTHIELFLKNSNPESLSSLIKVITSFYWGEVTRLTLQNNFQGIERYQGLLDFCQTLKDYQEYLLENNKQK